MMIALGSRGGSSGSLICKGGRPGAGISEGRRGSRGSVSYLGDNGIGSGSAGINGGSGSGLGCSSTGGVEDFFLLIRFCGA